MALKKVKKAAKKTAKKSSAKKKFARKISVKKKPAKKVTKKGVKKISSPKKKTEKKKLIKSPISRSRIITDDADLFYKRTNPFRTSTIELPVYNRSNINISGIGYDKEMKLRAAGIKTLDAFIELGAGGVAKIFAVNLDYAKSFIVKAKAIKDQKVYAIQPLSNLNHNAIMLDIETDYFEAKYANKTAWMVGMYDRPSEQFVQYVATNELEVSGIIEKTYDFLNSFSDRKIIVYSGSNFDATILKHRFEAYNRTHNHLDFKDILIEMRKCLAFPFKSMDLANVAEHYEYKFKHPHIDGQEVGLAWESHKHDMKKHRSFRHYLEYNEDDCRALNTIFENIYIKNNYHSLN
jgi:predicted RecB family nuclease